MDRRSFLRLSALAAAGAGTGVGSSMVRPRIAQASFGALVEDPDGVLDLPEGFTYTILQQGAVAMSDGYVVPAAHDGMACFESADGLYVLMRNHELGAALASSAYPDGDVPDEAYDAGVHGGVTRVVIDPETLEVVSSNLVLTGTRRNCAGGPSPWGWLSCEEDTSTDHGFVFLCDPEADAVAEPVRIDGYGRCNHEAAAIDPATNIAYLTEDRGDSCLYRFVPDDPAEPFEGTLQAMRVVGEDEANLAVGAAVGDVWDVDWVDLPDPTPSTDSLRFTARGLGAALIRRGEGIWHHGDRIYVCSTSGGPVYGGQVFCLRPDEGTLELVAQSEDRDVLDMPDNICVAPWDQLFMAEDGEAFQYVRGLDEDGNVFDFAKNAFSGSEIAGVCFSPDWRTMFVNLQNDAMTIAIRGPFPERPPDPEPEDEDDAGPADCADCAGDGDGGEEVALLVPAAAALALRRDREEVDPE